ncbi:MAG TPA: hypothetical protein VNO79_13050 [Actinomycetota bacterium]|nr:hypothetical protein [Actinomycetota bacterium]
MVRRALGPGALGLPVALGGGWALGGRAAAVSAALAVAVVLANFALHGLSLAWASTVSLAALHAVALGGVVVRLGAIVGLLLALRAAPWFSPLAFGLAVVPATLGLLAYEARLVAAGLGQLVQVPGDPVAAAAREGR